MKTFALWFTGLPGSGKSTLAKKLVKKLKGTAYLEMDEIRKYLTPERNYDEKERDWAYRAIAVIAKYIQASGKSVIIDATAHKRRYRDFARSILSNFYEIYVKCPIEECMRRETERKDKRLVAQMYKKALSGDRKSLGQVIGIDVPFEENRNTEIIVHSNSKEFQSAPKKILERLKRDRVV